MHKDIITRFNEYINSFRIEGESKIAVAVSGGADSLALTFLASEWAPSGIIALTVNHNLREESLAEAEQLHILFAKEGIEHHILNWEHNEKILSNIQHKARLARRALLTDWCNLRGIKTLLVAHTKNDIVETFFMNLFRGSGIYGLSSIPEETTVNCIRIIRPVSIFTKGELKSYLLERGIDWVEDPSNKNKRFLRTKVRNLLSSETMADIFPDHDLFLNRIITDVKNMARARDCIESITASQSQDMVTKVPTEIRINREKFCKAHKEIALNILSSSLIEMSQEHEYKPRLASLELVYNFILSNDKGAKTLWKCKINIAKDTIYIKREIGKDL